ncbi:MAG: fructose-bisphosphate aldolase class I [SAR202 cluster bacterium]|nr:fructose-bisphosphate aldolase class I [SAR202 cluster bacterium]|tara:strand:+ start:4776 stop:5780 length:1005 start_codon:yes stop_codon:yes gene_type:complete
MAKETLQQIAKRLVAKKKGILAADESTGTMGRRLESINVSSTEENRRAWRELLFTTEEIGQYISGVILYDETIRQQASTGATFVDVLKQAGVGVGIKVDAGTVRLPGSPDELITEGLDGLRQRLNEYRDLGAEFAKWRGVITIGPELPSLYCLRTNAHALARYAALCQEAGLVPIVEPEVLMDGDHGIDRCFEVTELALKVVFQELTDQGVELDGILLKPNMVISGASADDRADARSVAVATVECFKRTVPETVPGIVFLSGGQSDEEATVNLQAINVVPDNGPWEWSFSYGRGLQATPLTIWNGDSANVPAAQNAFRERMQVTSAARDGHLVS